jgi:UDP-2-acetamido-2,6-beta-L-arabino-hexul-4-ose reductase
LSLVYIDDIVEKFCKIIYKESKEVGFCNINPVYSITLGELTDQIKSFRENRKFLLIDRVGTGFLRALYSTFISYLPSSDFSYKIKQHIDQRGTFAEMLKTKDSGQFSFFTAHPGITRGEHYHHTKTEKFLVIKGTASFKFRNIITNEFCEILTSGEVPEIVDTIPGWAHNISNIGNEEMIVMLWANEIFDKEMPDTIHSKI